MPLYRWGKGGCRMIQLHRMPKGRNMFTCGVWPPYTSTAPIALMRFYTCATCRELMCWQDSSRQDPHIGHPAAPIMHTNTKARGRRPACLLNPTPSPCQAHTPVSRSVLENGTVPGARSWRLDSANVVSVVPANASAKCDRSSTELAAYLSKDAPLNTRRHCSRRERCA